MGESTNLGNFIRECRRGLRYTSRQVARLSNSRADIPSISNSYLISVENGKHIPRLDKVIALSDILNVPITHLVDRCRADMGARDGPLEGDFGSLFETAREHAEMNNYSKALELFRQAWQLAAGDGNGHPPQDVQARAEVRLQIANCYRRLKINRVAKEELENLLRERGLEVKLRARTALALTEIFREEGNTFLALVLAREALAIAQGVGDELLEAKLLSSLGTIAAEDMRFDEALALFRDAAQRFRKHGHERAATTARTQQGLALVAMREFHKAGDLLRAELNEYKNDDPYVRGWLHLALAKALYGAENYKATRVHARSAKECAERIEAPDLVFLAVYYLWLAARREKADDLAVTYFERLKFYRAKLDVNLNEVEAFDRMRSKADAPQAAEKGAVR